MTFVITNLDRPGYYWNNGTHEYSDRVDSRSARWVSEVDGSYKTYTSEAKARRAVARLCRAGYRIDIVRNPAEGGAQ